VNSADVAQQEAHMTEQNTRGNHAPGWQAEHAQRYLATNGADGHLWEGYPTLLLTTIGRRTGQAHTTPLIYGENGGRYLVVGSRGGAPEHPQWYRNLLTQPSVEVQVKADRFRARARPATAAEKPALWQQMVQVYPPYAEYQTRTTREIPVVILERE
jgi:deazaflavin-dependent oxidoreductase (nitroreductase family)